MHISDITMRKLLERGGIADDTKITSLLDQAKNDNTSLQEVIIANEIMDEKAIFKAFSEYTGIPFAEIDPSEIPSDILQKIPERIARQYNVVLFNIDEDGVQHLATDDPDDVQAIDFIKKELGENIKIYIATEQNILECLENYRGDVNEELNRVVEIQTESSTEDQSVKQEDIAEDSPIAQTVNLILEYAIRSNASDIHIEPRETFIQIRYRIDGVLKEVNQLPIGVLGALISRIKILSNLKN